MANENGNSSFAEARRNADITSMIPDANSSPNTATAAPPPPSSNNPNPSDASPPAQTSPAAGPAAGPAAPIPAAPTPAPAIATPAASSSPAQSEALREDMLKSAISFLSSANVQSAPTAKKIAFLRQKGLSQQEIEEAFKRVGSAPLASSSSNSSTTMTTPPSNALTNTTTTNHASLPPIPPRPRSTHVIYYQPPPPPVMPAQRVLTLALLMGFGAVGATAALVGIIRVSLGKNNERRTSKGKRERAYSSHFPFLSSA
ncbi:peroxisomal membrane anchor protein conserved region-domain-containing protein [Syncephalastrum racemosum]|uniref:Peroxisomal membrane protein PEX14 n=1 Tax=Syncephalastrum racemosum TaxID=13706 RepID=A0A1X2HWL2_SYNRA|nr:peroxisomal membrane anchor protein conserved region-domain-containing protein [Syncephalastrum racemosum]